MRTLLKHAMIVTMNEEGQIFTNRRFPSVDRKSVV